MSEVEAAPWCPDLGDGRYRNPILHADYSDPDAIRVGEDFWLTASSFSHVPGLPILHSRDLVNWTIVNHALPRLVPENHFSRPRPGQGVWAPSIRHHAGKFWIYYPDPDFGIYVVTADDPRGAWSEPTLVLAGKGLIDPCPFWDEDGTGWLVHAWAKSRAGINNRVTLRRLAADGLRVLDGGVVIIDGASLPGWHTIEGPKLYRRGIFYYVFVPANGVRDGDQAVFRSQRIDGPYEGKRVLSQGASPINGPHQGAWVDTPSGEHWFLHFQEVPAHGRLVHLQPMNWSDDGWPVLGDRGTPVLVHARPAGQLASHAVPATTDRFEAGKPGHQWQWQCNPQVGWCLAGDRSVGLKLACMPTDSLWNAGHLLLQKFPAPQFEATVRVRLASTADGDGAGLVVFGYDYAWLGLQRKESACWLELRVCLGANRGETERVIASVQVAGAELELRVCVTSEAHCEFSWSEDGCAFISIGESFQAVSSAWVGAKVGLVAMATAGAQSRGSAEFAWFRVAPLS